MLSFIPFRLLEPVAVVAAFEEYGDRPDRLEPSLAVIGLLPIAPVADETADADAAAAEETEAGGRGGDNAVFVLRGDAGDAERDR